MLVALVVQAVTASGFLDGLISAEKAHPTQHVIVDTEDTTGDRPRHGVVDLTMDRSSGRFLFTITNQVAGGPAASRRYFVTNGKLVAYGAGKEYVERNLKRNLSTGDNLIELLQIDPGVLLAIDPAAANKDIFRTLRGVRAWTKQVSATEIRYFHQDNGGGQIDTIELRISRNSGLPIAINYSHGAHKLLTTLAYDSKVRFMVPKTGQRVERFAAPVTLPRFVSDAAREVAEACRLAYSRLRSISAKIEGGEASSFIWQHGLARQAGPNITWAYDGSRLYMLSFSKRALYKGPIGAGEIPDYIGLLGVREEPMLMQLMRGENPMSVLYAPNQTATLVGSMKIGSNTVDILQLSTPGIRTQVQISRGNHLIVGLITENLSQAGSIMSRSKKSFNIQSANWQEPLSSFKISQPSGFRVLSLNGKR